jgi:hypothetical protein
MAFCVMIHFMFLFSMQGGVKVQSSSILLACVGESHGEIFLFTSHKRQTFVLI